MDQRVGVTRDASQVAAAPATTSNKAAGASPFDTQPPSSSDSHHSLRMRSTRRGSDSDNTSTEPTTEIGQAHLSTATSTGSKTNNKNASKRKTESATTENTSRDPRRDISTAKTRGTVQQELKKTVEGAGNTGSDDIMAVKRSWVLFALASGCFAALNGAFAKLTTTSLTSSFALAIHNALPILPIALTETLTRAFFFGLNLISNGIMWALFTRALTAHPSATKVSLVNTSSNFLVTALLGAVIFAENLKGLWWLGAGMLVVGNLVMGRERADDGDGEGAVDEDKQLTASLSGRNEEREELLGGDEVESARPDGEHEEAEHSGRNV